MLLNKQQKLAVETTEGPVMIVAGPGTGKTKTLISRIAYLISEKKVNPQNILALTFTNKAAAEMKNRLQKDFTGLPSITTFHGLAYALLAEFFENDSVAIISEEEHESIISELKKKYKTKGSVKDISLAISRYKNSIEKAIKKPLFFDEYNEILKKKNMMDFDDLLDKAYVLLQKDISKQSLLKNKYQYILIDEFQDTNEIQYELIKLILNKQNNLFVIGDPLQSIYSFRGADSSIFQKMKSEFKDSKEITLTINYRSHKNIIATSSLLFSQQPLLQTYSEKLGTVQIVETMHEYSEADWIIKTISLQMGGMDLLQAGDAAKHSNENIQFSDFAVIYRTHQLARVLEKKFDEAVIPYQLIGRSSLYEQNEYDPAANKVTLLTMHSSKGLEFKYVFICGFEDGIIPLTHGNEINIEEEKRLLYVGMTRAKEVLYLIKTRERMKTKSTNSRFQSLLNTSVIGIQLDEAIKNIEEKRKKYQEKKSQMQLFS